MRMKSALLYVVMCLLAPIAAYSQMTVRHPQGSAHGFVEVVTLEGVRIGIGDLMQRMSANRVSSRLVLHFFDGSVDDETTVYSQAGVFRLISDRHIQHGPSFPTALDVTIDAAHGFVLSTDEAGKVRRTSMTLPPDVANGMPSTILMNVLPSTPETRVAIVVPTGKPRLIHLSMKPAGVKQFTLGGTPRQATDYVVHVELGGAAAVIAPLIGKAPPDFHVWILPGADPAFIREEGPLYVGGPVWRIQQISASFEK